MSKWREILLSESEPKICSITRIPNARRKSSGRFSMLDLGKGGMNRVALYGRYWNPEWNKEIEKATVAEAWEIAARIRQEAMDASDSNDVRVIGYPDDYYPKVKMIIPVKLNRRRH